MPLRQTGLLGIHLDLMKLRMTQFGAYGHLNLQSLSKDMYNNLKQ